MNRLMKNDNALFYTCSLIEYIGRMQKQKRKDVVEKLTEPVLKRIYQYSDVLHCEMIEKVANEFTIMQKIEVGDFDNVAACRYDVPDYWTIGEVYERLIEDVTEEYTEENVLKNLLAVYVSWISDAISDYNTDFFYQSREYIAVCYKEGKILQ